MTDNEILACQTDVTLQTTNRNLTTPDSAANVTSQPSDSEATDLLTHGNVTNVFQEQSLSEVSKDFLKDAVEKVGEFQLNDTATDGLEWGNATALPVIMEPGNDTGGPAAVGTTESAVILAATFLLLAAVAYGGMIAWRRMLIVKYGTSDMLITDDVYDISDLRNFEI